MVIAGNSKSLFLMAIGGGGSHFYGIVYGPMACYTLYIENCNFANLLRTCSFIIKKKLQAHNHPN